MFHNICPGASSIKNLFFYVYNIMKVKVECLFPARERLGTQANLVTSFVIAKMFYNICTCGQCYKTFYFIFMIKIKLDCSSPLNFFLPFKQGVAF